MKYWISVGSNIEPRIWYIRKVMEFISEIASVEKVSAIYETEAVGFDSPSFINVCALIDTELMPETLMRFFKRIEILLGREPKRTYSSRFFYDARPADVDIIFWEHGVYASENVIIPHSHSHLRKFVLVPMIEMGEDIVHPTLERRLSEILEQTDDTSWIIKIADRIW